MKQRLLLFWTASAVALFSLQACSGSDPAPVDLGELIEDHDTPIAPPGDLGGLTDLGDLVEPAGDHWYFTRANALNDDGIVIGESNYDGVTTSGAFRWDPVTGGMSFLYIQPGFGFSEAIDINSSGRIVCNSTNKLECEPRPDKRKQAFLWQPEGLVRTVNLTPPGMDYSEVADINDRGEVVLTAGPTACPQSPPEDCYHAYFWNGTFSVLGRIVSQCSEAVAINENLQAVINSGDTVVFHDLNHDVVESLNHLPGATKTIAVDINDSEYVNNDDIPDGHVIGNSGVDINGDEHLTVWDDTVQGFFWDGGAMYPVDHLGGGTSEVTDMNDRDQVVGGATTAEESVHAFLWTLGEAKRGVIRDLGTLGGSNSFATGINEAGQVVGYSETGALYTEQGIDPVPIWHAFLWDKGVMYDLGVHNDFYDYAFVPPYPFSEAVDVNAGGEVAGNSITINSHYRGFFLLPDLP